MLDTAGTNPSNESPELTTVESLWASSNLVNHRGDLDSLLPLPPVRFSRCPGDGMSWVEVGTAARTSRKLLKRNLP